MKTRACLMQQTCGDRLCPPWGALQEMTTSKEVAIDLGLQPTASLSGSIEGQGDTSQNTYVLLAISYVLGAPPSYRLQGQS